LEGSADDGERLRIYVRRTLSPPA